MPAPRTPVDRAQAAVDAAQANVDRARARLQRAIDNDPIGGLRQALSHAEATLRHAHTHPALAQQDDHSAAQA